MLWILWILLAILVVVILIEMACRKPPLSDDERMEKAIWMAAYFGTNRPMSYCPQPREEGEKMVNFLKDVPRSKLRDYLMDLTKSAIASDRLPDAPCMDDHRYNLGRVIVKVCGDV